MTEENKLTDDEIASAVSQITEEDLRQRSEALDDAQGTWEDLAFISTEKIPCRECGGRGTMPAGSFGDIECPRCHGQRVVEHPGNDPFPMPPFAQLREAITAYGNALADRALPAGHRGKRGLALPPASSVPTLESLQKIGADGLAKAKTAKQLKAAPGIVDDKLLGERTSKNDDAEDAQFTDADLDEMEHGDDDE